jgi:hypothetical protein
VYTGVSLSLRGFKLSYQDTATFVAIHSENAQPGVFSFLGGLSGHGYTTVRRRL